MSLCRWVLLTTQREERTQTMRCAPGPRAVRHLGKRQSQSKSTEQTRWPCRLPFLTHTAGQDREVPPPTHLLPDLLAPRDLLSFPLPPEAQCRLAV